MQRKNFSVKGLPHPVILGSGCNAYGLARSFYMGGIASTLADAVHGPAFSSRIIAGHWLIPSPDQGLTTFRELSRRTAKLSGKVMIIPTNEPWVHLLNQYRDKLDDNIVLPLPGQAVTDLVLSKSAMHHWCMDNQVETPRTRIYGQEQDWPNFISWTRNHLPVILKPDTKGLNDADLGFTTAEFQTIKGLERWQQRIPLSGPQSKLLAQRSINQPGVKLVAWHGYRTVAGKVCMAGITKLRSRPPRLGGCTTAAVFKADAASLQACLDILQRLGFTGFFDLEFMIRPNGGPPVFIELNPRPGMPNHAATVMGLNLALIGLRDMAGQGPGSSHIVTNQPGIWFDMSTDLPLALCSGDNQNITGRFAAWIKSLGTAPRTDAYFYFKDPLVFPAACARLIRLGAEHLVKSSGQSHGPIRPQQAGGLQTRWSRLKSRAGFFHEQARNVGYPRMVRASLITRFRREMVFFQQDLEKPIAAPPELPGLTWRKLKKGDEHLLRGINPAISAQEVRDRISQGQNGWVFLLRGEPVHYRWEAKGRPYLAYLGTALNLKEDEIMHQASFTKRGFRRRGISSYACRVLLERSRDMGYVRMINGTAWWNLPSINNLRLKSLQKPAGSVVLWRLGPFKRLRASGNMRVDSEGNIFFDPAGTGLI
jgi:predicted ATP-grasp superfamily ATP-dependent carboligase